MLGPSSSLSELGTRSCASARRQGEPGGSPGTQDSPNDGQEFVPSFLARKRKCSMAGRARLNPHSPSSPSSPAYSEAKLIPKNCPLGSSRRCETLIPWGESSLLFFFFFMDSHNMGSPLKKRRGGALYGALHFLAVSRGVLVSLCLLSPSFYCP